MSVYTQLHFAYSAFWIKLKKKKTTLFNSIIFPLLSTLTHTRTSMSQYNSTARRTTSSKHSKHVITSLNMGFKAGYLTVLAKVPEV